MILNLLGAREKVEKHGFQVKRGVIFEWGPDQWSLPFNELGDDTPYAWQVVRSEFDKLLLDHAAGLGADVCEGVTITDLELADGRPIAANWAQAGAADQQGRITFDYLIDASGRRGLMANRYLRNRQLNEMFKNVAVWRYWRGTNTLKNGPEGSTGVFSTPSGWFWVIPLHDGTVSIGLVTGKDAFSARRGELGSGEAVYDEAVAACPGVLEAVSGAEPVTELRFEQDYSYCADSFTGPGYLLAGDAACFLDPLLSTGVHLATYSAMLAAAGVASILRGEVTEQAAFAFYQKSYRRSYERMVLMISAFYDSYRGKDHHFYQAQRLSAREKNSLLLHETFLRIISGVEDLEDAREAAFDAVVSELRSEDGESPFKHLPGMRDEPISAEHAIDGLYVRLAPDFGLARAEPTEPA